MPENIDGRVILLILFVVISAVKWLIEKIQANDQAAEQEEPTDNLETLYDEYRDEIRQRQTKLEKRQATQTPPPIPVQATVQAPARPPARPPVAAPAPPVYTQRQSTSMGAPVSTPVSTAQPSPSFKPRQTTVSAEQKAAASRFEQLSSGKSKQSPQSYVRALLSNPQSTRQAIILTEILGKPKSLQSS